MIKYSFYKRGQIYWVQLYFYGKRIQKSTGSKNVKDAEKYTRLYLSDLLREKELGTDKTFAYIVDKWVEYASVRKKTFNDNVYQIKVMLDFFGKETKLSEITSERVQEFFVHLSTLTSPKRKKLSQASVNRYIALLKTIYNHAISLGLIKEHPVKVKKYKEKPRKNYYTEEELDRLLEAVFEISAMAQGQVQYYFKYIFLIALFTGMRLSEILNLKHSDIKDGAFYIQEDKENVEKYVPVPPKLLEILLAELPHRSEHLFDLKRRRPDIIRRVWLKAKEKANVEGRFHDLRRTFAVVLQRKRVDMRTIQSLLGHQNITTTQTYTSGLEELKKKAVEGLDIPELPQ